MNKKKSQIKNIFICVLLVTLAIGWRLINNKHQLAPNLELVTTASVLAAITIGYKAAIIVPLSIMIISDLFIGNSSIFVFTWGSFAAIGLLSTLLRKLNSKPKTQVATSLGFAFLVLFCFLS